MVDLMTYEGENLSGQPWDVYPRPQMRRDSFLNLNGEWELIDNAKVINNGEALSFTVNDFSPFAIVVDTSESGDSPVTGISTDIVIYGALMVMSALAIVVLVVSNKKRA